MKKQTAITWCFILALSLSGCGIQRVYSFPPWIYRPPLSEKYIYVTGSSGKSINPWEAKELAIQNALVKLAQKIGSEVFTSSLNRSEGGSTWEGAQFIRTSTQASLRKALVVKFWADPKGEAGLGYRIYVLVRLKKSTIVKN